MAHFNTEDYRRSHGKAPRGTGCWVFMPNGTPDLDEWLFSPSLSYAQAKEWAKRQRPDVDQFSVGS